MTRGQGMEFNGRKPKAPAHLSDMEKLIWHSVCKHQTSEWCELAASGALLEMYCVAVAHYRFLVVVRNKLRAEQADPEAVSSTLDKLSLSIAHQSAHVASLATKLRLTPQTRIDRKTARHEPPTPWDPEGMFPEDDGDTA